MKPTQSSTHRKYSHTVFPLHTASIVSLNVAIKQKKLCIFLKEKFLGMYIPQMMKWLNTNKVLEGNTRRKIRFFHLRKESSFHPPWNLPREYILQYTKH